MPIYVYKFVDTDETIEIQQSFTDDTLTEAVHPETGETLEVKKVFQPVGVTFKGSGFYKTDSRGGSSSTTSTSSDSSGSTPAASSSSADSSGTSSSGTSSSSTSSSTSGSGSGSSD